MLAYGMDLDVKPLETSGRDCVNRSKMLLGVVCLNWKSPSEDLFRSIICIDIKALAIHLTNLGEAHVGAINSSSVLGVPPLTRVSKILRSTAPWAAATNADSFRSDQIWNTPSLGRKCGAR